MVMSAVCLLGDGGHGPWLLLCPVDIQDKYMTEICGSVLFLTECAP